MRTTLLTLFLTLSLAASAQEIKTVGYTYTYFASPNESPEQARRSAIAQAKVEALRKEFGSVISGASASQVIEKNGIANSKFMQISSEGEVNGEWIADLIEPVLVEQLKDGALVVMATVKGKGQEITTNKIEFDARILRNTPDVKFESSEFVAGNDLYVSFTSPVDGFLTIYLLDGENAYCLLPYSSNADGVFPIEHNHQYILFSRKHPAPNEDASQIEEYILTADEDMQDLNQLYFIFSPNKFHKAIDVRKQDPTGLDRPRQLTWEAFQKWILKARKRDRDMVVQTKYVVIKPKQ